MCYRGVKRTNFVSTVIELLLMWCIKRLTPWEGRINCSTGNKICGTNRSLLCPRKDIEEMLVTPSSYFVVSWRLETAACSDCSNQLSDDTRVTLQIMGQIKRLKNNSDNGGSICIGTVIFKLHTQNNTPKCADWREGNRRIRRNKLKLLWQPANLHVCILVGFGQQLFFCSLMNSSTKVQVLFLGQYSKRLLSYFIQLLGRWGR
jgi:hypothetical protein